MQSSSLSPIPSPQQPISSHGFTAATVVDPTKGEGLSCAPPVVSHQHHNKLHPSSTLYAAGTQTERTTRIHYSGATDTARSIPNWAERQAGVLSDEDGNATMDCEELDLHMAQHLSGAAAKDTGNCQAPICHQLGHALPTSVTPGLQPAEGDGCISKDGLHSGVGTCCRLAASFCNVSPPAGEGSPGLVASKSGRQTPQTSVRPTGVNTVKERSNYEAGPLEDCASPMDWSTPTDDETKLAPGRAACAPAAHPLTGLKPASKQVLAVQPCPCDAHAYH